MKLALFYLITLAAISMAEETQSSVALRRGNDRFTSKMFTEIVKEKPRESVVLSAFSVLTPLAQLALASEGESHDELLSAIGMPNDNATKEAFSQVDGRLKSVQGVELKTASKIYVAENYKLNENFAATTRSVFNSEIKNVDFTKSEKTAKEINSWVEDQTNNKIKDLVDPSSLDSDTRAVLVNAIYFKGKWKSPFNKLGTYEGDFHVDSKKTVKVQMMYQKSDFKYAEVPDLDAKVLQMFYEGDQASMVFVLPNKIDGITQLEEKLRDPAALNRAMSKLYETEVEVTIPKFKIETTTDLKKVLEKMDVKKLFTPGQARLDRLLNGETDLYVSEAIQKAFIEVNEEGAEAAAANVFIAVAASLPINEPPPKTFFADRPFYFEIRTNEIPLFTGVKFQ